ncbi:hypothetical protein HAX54_040626, partial [Datura stramonium]|nr:hypothetical protein [Datura stramonium]
MHGQARGTAAGARRQASQRYDTHEAALCLRDGRGDEALTRTTRQGVSNGHNPIPTSTRKMKIKSQ